MIQVFTPEEVAIILKVKTKEPVRTVIRMCATGKLPGAAKAGRSWRIPASALEALFAAAPAAEEASAATEIPVVDELPAPRGRARGPRAPGLAIPDPAKDRAGFLRLLRKGIARPQRPRRAS